MVAVGDLDIIVDLPASAPPLRQHWQHEDRKLFCIVAFLRGRRD